VLGGYPSMPPNYDLAARLAYVRQYTSGIGDVVACPVEPVLDLLGGIGQLSRRSAILRDDLMLGVLDFDVHVPPPGKLYYEVWYVLCSEPPWGTRPPPPDATVPCFCLRLGSVVHLLLLVAVQQVTKLPNRVVQLCDDLVPLSFRFYLLEPYQVGISESQYVVSGPI
jgi:hypothetical protein